MSKYGRDRTSSFWDIRLQGVALFLKRAIAFSRIFDKSKHCTRKQGWRGWGRTKSVTFKVVHRLSHSENMLLRKLNNFVYFLSDFQRRFQDCYSFVWKLKLSQNAHFQYRFYNSRFWEFTHKPVASKTDQSSTSFVRVSHEGKDQLP